MIPPEGAPGRPDYSGPEYDMDDIFEAVEQPDGAFLDVLKGHAKGGDDAETAAGEPATGDGD